MYNENKRCKGMIFNAEFNQFELCSNKAYYYIMLDSIIVHYLCQRCKNLFNYEELNLIDTKLENLK